MLRKRAFLFFAFSFLFVGSNSEPNVSKCSKENHTQFVYKNFHALPRSCGDHDVLYDVSFYAKSTRDINILLSSTKSYDTKTSYEFVVAGANRSTDLYIRTNQSRTQEKFSNNFLINKNGLNTFNIKVTKDGKLYLDANGYEYVWSSPNVAKVQYIAFASCNNEPIEYFFNCPDSWSSCSKCKHEFTSVYEYKNYYDIPKVLSCSDDNYKYKFTVYAKATRDVNILLTPTKSFSYGGKGNYELIIQGSNYPTITIRTGDKYTTEKNATTKSLLNNDENNKITFKIAKNGKLHVDVNGFEYIYNIPDIIHINYVAFASYNKEPIDYHFNCGCSSSDTDKSKGGNDKNGSSSHVKCPNIGELLTVLLKNLNGNVKLNSLLANLLPSISGDTSAIKILSDLAPHLNNTVKANDLLNIILPHINGNASLGDLLKELPHYLNGDININDLLKVLLPYIKADGNVDGLLKIFSSYFVPGFEARKKYENVKTLVESLSGHIAGMVNTSSFWETLVPYLNKNASVKELFTGFAPHLCGEVQVGGLLKIMLPYFNNDITVNTLLKQWITFFNVEVDVKTIISIVLKQINFGIEKVTTYISVPVTSYMLHTSDGNIAL